MSGAPKAACTLCVTRTVQAAFLVSANCAGRSPLGHTASHARTPIKRRLPKAVVAPAALAGVATAFAVPGTHAATPPIPETAAHHAAATNTLPSTATLTELLTVAQPAAKGKHHRAALPATYTVKPGDTLSSIAQRLYHSPKYWTVLYWANKAKITSVDEITAGLVLKVPPKPAKIPAAPPVPAPAVPAATYGGGSGTSGTTASPPARTVSTSGGSAFQQCVIQRESGGNPDAWNGPYWGLYQFSASTWAEYGGNPADFGHAGVAEQNQVFENAMAAGGESNWAPYDGC
jgi:LysM repeat protein